VTLNRCLVTHLKTERSTTRLGLYSTTDKNLQVPAPTSSIGWTSLLETQTTADLNFWSG